MRGLDEWITGGRYSRWLGELTCAKCAHVWRAPMFDEYGGTFFEDDDLAFCPECHAEHEGEIKRAKADASAPEYERED